MNGQKLKEIKITSPELRINTDWGRGLFILKFKDVNGNVVDVQKLVVQ